MNTLACMYLPVFQSLSIVCYLIIKGKPLMNEGTFDCRCLVTFHGISHHRMMKNSFF